MTNKEKAEIQIAKYKMQTFIVITYENEKRFPTLDELMEKYPSKANKNQVAAYLLESKVDMLKSGQLTAEEALFMYL